MTAHRQLERESRGQRAIHTSGAAYARSLKAERRSSIFYRKYGRRKNRERQAWLFACLFETLNVRATTVMNGLRTYHPQQRRSPADKFQRHNWRCMPWQERLPGSGKIDDTR